MRGKILMGEEFDFCVGLMELLKNLAIAELELFVILFHSRFI